MNKRIGILLIIFLVFTILVTSNYLYIGINNNNSNNNNNNIHLKNINFQQQIEERDKTIQLLKQQLQEAENRDRDSDGDQKRFNSDDFLKDKLHHNIVQQQQQQQQLERQRHGEQDQPDLGIRFYDKELDVRNKSFAYAFYITNNNYYCAASITAHRLRQWTNYDIVFIFLDELIEPSQTTTDKLNKLPNIHFQHIDHQIKKTNGGDPTWKNSLNKFYVFNLTQYDRIVFLDADTFVLKSLDHLFFIPPCTLAAPRAYWLPQQPFFTSLLMVIQPSEEIFKKIVAASRGHSGFDMDVLNDYFVNHQDFLMLPGIYGLLNGEFSTNEKHWFGDNYEDTYNNKAYLYHWSSFKPWNAQPTADSVSNRGELLKETYNSYHNGKHLYC